MRVLVIGGGGREHALCWKIARSATCDWIACVPGNAGIAEVAELLDFDTEDHQAVITTCEEYSVDLVVVGPEAPLVSGLPDALRAAGLSPRAPSRRCPPGVGRPRPTTRGRTTARATPGGAPRVE